jgi:inositol transport system ATP-binding protein
MQLQVRNLSKSFPGVRALQDVSLDVAPGTVHALMGENGAGKSTLMKIVAGLERPDAGEIRFDGQPVRLRNPHDALKRGVAMIHQELLVFPELTVAENIFMGQEPAAPLVGWLDRRRMEDGARALLERLRVSLPPRARLKELSVAQQQTVEIAKALAHRAELIIMDEPTSAISQPEVEALFGVIRDLKRQNVAVIYISHRMEEVFRIADVVTVLRDGRHVATQPIGELNAQKLIALMAGRELDLTPRQASGARGDVALAVRSLSRRGAFHDVSFEVGRGEVLGIAGLMGAGRTELLNAIYGLAPADAGTIEVHGVPVHIAAPRDAMRRGIALVTEDRRALGLVLQMSVQHNLTLSTLERCSRGGFVNDAEERRVADEMIETFSIRTPRREQRVSRLSGGNQQKVVMARALLAKPEILLLDEPTRGIDIAAKADVYALIGRLANEGKAIVLVSSELPEVLSLSDRVLVMREGTIGAELDPRHVTQEEVLRHAMPVAGVMTNA